jgi:hypothetical protein
VTPEKAVHIKARAVLRERGHAEGETSREYTDWHIVIRGGANFISVWWSGAIVFLSMAGVPVYYRPGPWEQYLDRLFHRLPLSDPGSGRS